MTPADIDLLVSSAANFTGFDDSAKATFHKLAKRYLKEIADILRIPKGTYDIVSNVAGPASLGEVYLHGIEMYFQIGGNANCGMLFARSCKSRKDTTGGINRWVSSGLLQNQVLAAHTLFRMITPEEVGGIDEMRVEYVVQAGNKYHRLDKRLTWVLITSCSEVLNIGDPQEHNRARLVTSPVGERCRECFPEKPEIVPNAPKIPAGTPQRKVQVQEYFTYKCKHDDGETFGSWELARNPQKVVIPGFEFVDLFSHHGYAEGITISEGTTGTRIWDAPTLEKCVKEVAAKFKAAGREVVEGRLWEQAERYLSPRYGGACTMAAEDRKRAGRPSTPNPAKPPVRPAVAPPSRPPVVPVAVAMQPETTPYVPIPPARRRVIGPPAKPPSRPPGTPPAQVSGMRAKVRNK